MARYIMEEMPDIQKTGKRITYPKFARIDNASIKELAQRVGDVSGFSAGDIEGVLLQTAIEMAHLMAEGRSVKIDGIGTFTPSLALCRDKNAVFLMTGFLFHRRTAHFLGDGLGMATLHYSLRSLYGQYRICTFLYLSVAPPSGYRATTIQYQAPFLY